MIEINPLKHEPPWTCKLNRILFGASPSAIMGQCLLGRMSRGGGACVGCTANVHEIMWKGFQEGLERGEKLPSIYDQLKAYVDEEHPPEAYKTEESETPSRAEVRHGVWKDDCGDLVCSLCSFSCGDAYYLGSRKYCPECGAEMKDEE
jgi:hypothetical protein